MEITVQELSLLDRAQYRIIDIRKETELAYGLIPEAVCIPADQIEGNPEIDFSKKLIICCSRGENSLKVAQKLTDMGYDAVSLAGGYTAWLLFHVREEQKSEVSKKAEQSIRKKFRKSIWSKFTKAINQYELIKEGDSIAVCISGGKRFHADGKAVSGIKAAQ